MNAGFGIGITLNADGLARSLAGPGIGLGALTADRQPTQMADAAITLDGLEALEVQTDFAAQVAFGDVFAVLDGVDELRQLLFVQIFGAQSRIDAGLGQDRLGIDRSDAIDITQRDFDAFIGGDIDSENAWHISLLTLTLFVAGVGADDANDSFATHNLAVLAKSFD